MALVLLVLMNVALIVALGLEKARHDRRENDLMDRLMSRSYGEYAAFRQAPQMADVPERRILSDDTGIVQVDLDDLDVE